jgi:ribonuclease BN (tRNA processing enzyme)
MRSLVQIHIQEDSQFRILRQFFQYTQKKTCRNIMNINLKILGCSGGIGGQGMRTTSLLLGEKILIDAGTGVGDLSLVEMSKIDHVFLTHAHLDHITALPLMIDSVFGMNPKPLQVFAPSEVIQALQNTSLTGPSGLIFQ